jgi:hypothetical protein
MTVKEENLSVLKWIQEKSSGTDQLFESVFNVGEKIEFQIRINGLGESQSNIEDYEQMIIQILEFPRVEPESLAPTDMEIPLPDGSTFKINMNWSVAASPVYPDADDRFSGMPWAQGWKIVHNKFNYPDVTCSLVTSPDTVCDIVRHCYKLTNLKAFW